MINLAISRKIKFFLFYFVLLSLIGLALREIPGQPQLTDVAGSFKHPKYGDPNSFIAGAIDLFENGQTTEPHKWLFWLWPPGFIYMEAAILFSFGPNAPFIIILILSSAALFSFGITQIHVLFSHRLGHFKIGIIAVSPFLFPVTRLFLIQPEGVVFGEFCSIAFFLIGSLYTALSVQRKSYFKAIVGGICFGASAYFRSQYEIIVSTLCISGALVCGLILVLRICCKFKSSESSTLVTHLILCVIISSQAIMLPWRLVHYSQGKTFSWVITSRYTYSTALKSDQEIIQGGGGWLVQGGANIAYHLNSAPTNMPDKTVFFSTLLRHPFKWLTMKAKLFNDYWFSSLSSFTAPSKDNSTIDNVFNAILIILAVSVFPLGWLTRKNLSSLTLLGIYMSFVLCFLMVSLLCHFETRYLFSMKIIGAFNFAIFSCFLIVDRSTLKPLIIKGP